MGTPQSAMVKLSCQLHNMPQEGSSDGLLMGSAQQSRSSKQNLCFTMTINKSQGQSVGNVGLNLKNAVFTHGQLYVVISQVTNSQNIKAIWDEKNANSVTKNIVYPEVIID
jgi:hypothetical protein